VPTTPQITLTANLETILAGAETGGFLEITLCGYGSQIPAVPGTCLLADGGVPQRLGPQVGSTPLSIALYGNDIIVPSGTFYSVAVLDQNRNVVQANNYNLAGSGTQDLSTLAPIVPPYGFPIGGLRFMACEGSLVGGNRNFTAPGTIVAAVYNGSILPDAASAPPLALAATVSGNVATLNFDPEAGDFIYAFCVL